MTRTRKLTLTVKEFSHLVSESLDIPHPHAPLATQSFVSSIPVVSENPSPTKPARPSSFHRIFARSPPSPSYSACQFHHEGGTETSRKMIAWPFPRSTPRKNRRARDDSEDMVVHTESEDVPESRTRDETHSNSMDSITSLAAASMSSLGSLLPADERLFQVMSRDGFFSEETSSSTQNRSSSVRAGPSSPFKLSFPLPHTVGPTGHGYSGRDVTTTATRTRVESMFGNGSVVSIIAVTDASTSVNESQGQTEVWCRRRLTQSSESSATTTSYRDSLSVDVTESGSDEDPTPRALTFGTKLAPAVNENESRTPLEDVSNITPPSNSSTISDAEFHTTTPGRTHRPRTPSPVTKSSVGVVFPQNLSPSPSRAQTPTVPFDTPPPPKIVTVSPAGSPRLRSRSLSRGTASPPIPGPPPTGPLPAVPSTVPPVPPLPPLLSKKSTMKISPLLPVSSPSRTPSSGLTGVATATPPSPPGGLRLPSRLSWVNTVRAALPSPPASPIKASKGRSSPSLSPPREKRKSGGLKRPTSISVIEAADNGQVRRTKSILLLTARSKSHASLGATKRVQIHAEANTESSAPRKPRRKSSAATMYPPIPLSSASESALASTGSELLVPRERRHSAPLLSSGPGPGANAVPANADWTLSLPFCTDAPGNQIPEASLLLDGQQKLEELPREDWTLCMPLRVRRVTPALPGIEGCSSECTTAEIIEPTQIQIPAQTQTQTQTQLPTPSPSPTLPSPPASIQFCPLEEVEVEELEPRPASPASLGPHAGGLDIDGGRGKRASGWHVYGWFDEVELRDEVRVPLQVHMKGHVSQDSTITVSTTGGTVYHSARSSLMVD